MGWTGDDRVYLSNENFTAKPLPPPPPPSRQSSIITFLHGQTHTHIDIPILQLPNVLSFADQRIHDVWGSLGAKQSHWKSLS